MADISLGYDPAAPGKYPVKKLLVDSDLDGILCASMLRVVYPQAKIITADATAMQLGEFNDKVDKNTVICDLKYIDGCGLYFDHHISNKPSTDEFPGRWRNTDSAAHVVYDYYRKDFDLSRFAEIIPEADKFDMGKVTLQEILNPNPVIQLGMSIRRDAEAFNQHLIELLSEKKFSEVLQDPEVTRILKDNRENRDRVLEYVRKHSQKEAGLVFIDMRGFREKLRVSSFLYTVDFPEADAAVVFKFAANPAGLNVRLYHNNFKKDVFEYDLLKIAREMNAGLSGGHRKTAGFTPAVKTETDQLKKEMLTLFAGQNKALHY